MIDILIKLADDLDRKGLSKESNYLDSIIQKMAAPEKLKGQSRGECIFQSDHPKVLDNKDHFPINTLAQARNALARVNQYEEAPPWYDGSLNSLLKTVVRAVESKYEDLEVSEEASKPKPKKGG